MYKKLLTYLLLCLLILKLVTVVDIGESEGQKINTALTRLYYILDYVILFCSISFFLISKNKRFKYSFLGYIAVLLLLLIFTSLLNDQSYGAVFIQSFKLIFPLIFYVSIKEIRFKQYHSFVYFIPYIIFFLSLYALFTFPPSMNRNEQFWPVYFSGLHTQCYILLSCTLLVFVLSRCQSNTWFVKSFFVFAIYGILFGYNVRTTIVGLLIFSIPFVSRHLKRYLGLGRFFIYYVVITFSLLLAFYFVYYSFENIDFFSSGRLSMYIFKFQMVANRDLLFNLFGNGIGSDLVITDVWWWDEKGSHNDYLTILVEFGFLFLIVLILLFRWMYRQISDSPSRSIFLVYSLLSLFSNAFFFRPLPALLILLCLAIAESYRLNNSSREFTGTN